MSDLQLSAHPADPTHTKLLEVDLELAAQEAELITQLEAIQEKRKGLKTVMELFIPANPPAAESTNKPEPVAEALPVPPLEPLITTPPTEAEAAPAPLPVPNKTIRPARRQRTTQTAKSKRAKQPNWQPYVQAEYAQTSLAEVVAQILQDQPDEVFGIPTIVHAIFEDEIPKAAWNQARNRISNILAEGARKNRWYRDQTGQYSLSSAAVGASLS